MKRFVEGEDRRQGALLPHCLDDYVTEDNPVRVIEAFIDELDLATPSKPGLQSSDATEDLSLRLSQPRAVEPAARTGCEECLKIGFVLKSGASRPVSHISSEAARPAGPAPMMTTS